MMNHVVCIKKDGWALRRPMSPNEILPVYGKIYTVLCIDSDPGFIETGKGYILKEIPDSSWNVRCFRPTDSTFGEVVCETISKQIEYHKSIEV